MPFFILLIALFISTAISVRKPRLSIALAVLFLPWIGLGFDAGLSITPYQIFMAPLLVTCIIWGLGVKDLRENLARLGFLGLIVAYAVIWSLIQLFWLPDADIYGGAARSPLVRAVSQIVMFFILLSPLIVICVLLRRPEEHIDLARIYIKSVVVLCIVGWIQIAIWLVTGNDPFPVGIVNQILGGQGSIRSGSFGFEGHNIIRMSSFGGEPKGLGASIAIALLILQAVGITSRIKVWYCWLFLLTSLLSTFSTMAILGWAGATVTQLVMSARSGFNSRLVKPKRIRKKIIISILVSLLAVSALVVTTGPDKVFGLLSYRTTERVQSSEYGYLEEFNVAIISFLLSQPQYILSGVGLGNVHLYADEFLPVEVRYYASGTAFVAKSGALRWISEVGMVSFLGLLVWGAWVVRRAAYGAIKYGEINYSIAFDRIFVGILAFWMVSGYVASQFFLMLGILYSLALVYQRISSTTFKSTAVLKHEFGNV